MELLEAIKTRRSIRKYKATPIDNITIELVLGVARWAPSWANTQCWKFIVVRGDDVKNKLAAHSLGLDTVHIGGFDAIQSVLIQARVVYQICAILN